MLSWALEDQQSVLGAWALVGTWLGTSLSFFSRRCFETSLKVSAMEEGAGVSIWESGALFWGDWIHAMHLGLHISDMPHDCSPVA